MPGQAAESEVRLLGHRQLNSAHEPITQLPSDLIACKMDQPPNGRHFSDVELLPSAQPRISKSEDTPNEIGEKKDATSEIKSWRGEGYTDKYPCMGCFLFLCFLPIKC